MIKHFLPTGGEINAPLHDILRRRWNQVRRGLVANQFSKLVFLLLEN